MLFKTALTHQITSLAILFKLLLFLSKCLDITYTKHVYISENGNTLLANSKNELK